MSNTIKLGLLGSTGAGKDTCVKILQKHYGYLQPHFIRLADPLYQGQNAIYKICQTEKEDSLQDGILLNFLGTHMRKIAPNVLKDSFIKNLENVDPKAQLIVCSDARPIDVPFLRDADFTIVHIVINPEIAIKRRQLRGDLSLGSANHLTERGLTPDLYDYQFLNNGTLDEFKNQILSFIQGLLL